ncbi:MAG: Flagellar basal-body rod protein FlgF [Alphaproteobacteria bacterium ADurb.Bin438]|nr:MAG: Flagellar basal-body rod protein FlgF [Alphaproteobacteria bacterium ADurb.Bin438]
MENTLYVALSRQTALWRNLETSANNMANMNTPAYKAMEPHFTQYFTKTSNDERLLKDKLTYTHDFGIVRDLSDGALQKTGNDLDFGINGDGYFVLDTVDGERYTRNGHFKLNNEGMIVTEDGNPLLGQDGKPFFIAPDEAKITLFKDGTLSTENGPIGKVKLVAFDDRLKLKETYSGMYKTVEGNEPKETVETALEQGMLEQSNVKPVVEMTKVIALHRAYEATNKLIDAENQRRDKMMDTFARVYQ